MTDTVNYGEYGDRQYGITSSQFVRDDYGRSMDDPIWYLVTYSIENLANIGGTLEVLEVKKVVDEFGMSSMTLQSVTDEQFDFGEKALKMLLSKIGQEIG